MIERLLKALHRKGVKRSRLMWGSKDLYGTFDFRLFDAPDHSVRGADSETGATCCRLLKAMLGFASPRLRSPFPPRLWVPRPSPLAEIRSMAATSRLPKPCPSARCHPFPERLQAPLGHLS